MALTIQGPVQVINDEQNTVETSPKEINTHKSSSNAEQESLMSAIQFGILHSLAKITPKPKRDLLLPDFLTVENISFPHQGSEFTPAHKYSDFAFKSYSPVAFRHLRDHFDILPEDFIASVCYTPLKQLGNPGASGSVFYLTQDDKFIIKTVSYKEAIFLQKLLAGYWINLLQNSQTLLPKFYGLYSYQSGNRKIRFVIMNNLLPSTIKYQSRFDLKGSTYGRRASFKEKRKNSPTFKDLDFLQMFPKGISLSLDMYDKLINTLRRDCTVLESFDIMDYSLLLAVHNVSEEYRVNRGKYDVPVETHVVNTDTMIGTSASNDSDLSIICEPSTPNNEQEAITLSSYIQRIPDGDVIATLPNGDTVVLYVGIIDILQNYRAKKKLEHAVKTFITKGDTISVHNPRFYSNRFKNFMSTTVFRCEEAHNQNKPGVKRITSNNTVSELMLLHVGRGNVELRWTPPPEYIRAKSTSDLNRINSDEDSVFTEDGDPIRYSNLDLNRFTPVPRASNSPGQTQPFTLRMSVMQTDL